MNRKRHPYDYPTDWAEAERRETLRSLQEPRSSLGLGAGLFLGAAGFWLGLVLFWGAF